MLRRLTAGALAFCALVSVAAAQTPTVTDFTKTFEKRDGYFPVYWDGAKGRLFLEVRVGEDFLYLPSLATGLGDASLGMDRGAIGDEQIARFDRVGPRVQLVLENPRFRAVSDNDALARSVRESFPLSTVARISRSSGKIPQAIAPVSPPGTRNSRFNSGSRTRSATSVTNSSIRLAP